jgi:ATP-dependent DNA ligase
MCIADMRSRSNRKPAQTRSNSSAPHFGLAVVRFLIFTQLVKPRSELMFRRGKPFFYAFDALWIDGQDLRLLPLIDRKARLRKLIGRRRPSRLLYLDHLERNGSALFARICELDCEGVVAKWRDGQYLADNRRSSWVKVKNPNYSQIEGRDELFERHSI